MMTSVRDETDRGGRGHAGATGSPERLTLVIMSSSWRRLSLLGDPGRAPCDQRQPNQGRHRPARRRPRPIERYDQQRRDESDVGAALSGARRRAPTRGRASSARGSRAAPARRTGRPAATATKAPPDRTPPARPRSGQGPAPPSDTRRPRDSDSRAAARTASPPGRARDRATRRPRARRAGCRGLRSPRPVHGPPHRVRHRSPRVDREPAASLSVTSLRRLWGVNARPAAVVHQPRSSIDTS